MTWQTRHTSHRILRPGPGVFVFFEHKNPGPFALYHAIAVRRKRAAGVRDITRSPSHALTPPKHNIDSDPPVIIDRGHACAHHLKGLRHCVIGDGTSRGHRKGRALEVMLHDYMAGGCVVHQLGHHKRVHPVFAVLIDGAVIVIPGADAAPGSAQTPHQSVPTARREIECRIVDGFLARQQGELGEPVIERHLLAVERAFGFKPTHLAANLIDNRSTSRKSSGPMPQRPSRIAPRFRQPNGQAR